MRIAWLGPVGEGAGVPGIGALLMECMLRSGLNVDYYTADPPEGLPTVLRSHPRLRIIRSPSRWQWGRWYSRSPFLAFISGTLARARVYNRLAASLVESHAEHPYDCVFQWSIAELFSLGKHIDELPPLIVFPCVHAAGELRWHRRESKLARRSENLLMHYAVRTYLMFRARYQKRQLRKPSLVLGLSRRFNQLLVEDYGLQPDRMDVLYHPIAQRDAAPEPLQGPADASRRVLRLLFVARISVRKGVEQVIELSRRLDDLRDRVQIEVIGGRTQWSDYTKLLRDLNPRTATYRGQLHHPEIMATYSSADVLLVPSMYEPGGIVVGEALSRGLCVVASDEVGSAEAIATQCCRIFPAGDVDAFERMTRELVEELSGHARVGLRTAAYEEARRVFHPDVVGGRLVEILERAVSRSATATTSVLGRGLVAVDGAA